MRMPTSCRRSLNAVPQAPRTLTVASTRSVGSGRFAKPVTNVLNTYRPSDDRKHRPVSVTLHVLDDAFDLDPAAVVLAGHQFPDRHQERQQQRALAEKTNPGIGDDRREVAWRAFAVDLDQLACRQAFIQPEMKMPDGLILDEGAAVARVICHDARARAPDSLVAIPPATSADLFDGPQHGDLRRRDGRPGRRVRGIGGCWLFERAANRIFQRDRGASHGDEHEHVHPASGLDAALVLQADLRSSRSILDDHGARKPRTSQISVTAEVVAADPPRSVTRPASTRRAARASTTLRRLRRAARSEKRYR